MLPLDATTNGQQMSRRQLVLALDKFSNALMRNLQRFIQIEDISGVGTIWICCIICLGHLAVLCHLISRTEPTLRSSMDDMFNLTVEKLANLSHEVHIKEYSRFDVLTGVRISSVFP